MGCAYCRTLVSMGGNLFVASLIVHTLGFIKSSHGAMRDFLGVFILLSVLLLWRRSQRVWQESLLVVHDLGVQVKRKYYSGREDCRFVERGRIQEVIINEGVGYATVTYYLAVLTSDDPDMMLAFRELIPALDDLLYVFHCLRSVILGEDTADWNKISRPDRVHDAAAASTVTSYLNPSRQSVCRSLSAQILAEQNKLES